MAIPNIDFEGSNNQVEVNNTNSNTEEPIKQDDVTNLSGDDVEDVSNTGVKETVDGKCGFAVENGNPIAAWNAMTAIKAKGKSYYLKACQLWVKQEFDKDTNYKKYIDLYKSIV